MKNWQTLTETIKRTGKCRTTILRYCDIPGVCIHIGKQKKFDPEEVDKVLAKIDSLQKKV